MLEQTVSIPFTQRQFAEGLRLPFRPFWNAAVPWTNPDLLDPRASAEGPTERMFPPATPHHKHSLQRGKRLKTGS